jgi:tetratricopeptide (TPR) repeat protein/predicted Ser/Thr protein kinase
MSEQDETEQATSGRPAGDWETIGPYQVLGSIGKGGMGEVLLARDPRLGRKVAIKRIRAEGGAESRRRFQREARLAASLSHPSIVPVYDLVVLGEHEHLVMELVEGPSLAQWLEGDHGLAAKLQIAEQIAAGLAYAHRHGIVHRDLKTENVLLSADDQAKIADFGIARRNVAPLAGAAGGGLETSTELHTREGALLGTYRSMSPEQARGEPADQRSDLFSFGVLLYEMFSGESPFRDASPLETLFRLTSKPHRPIRELAPELPPGLERLIDQLLEKDPELRPRSALEALQQIRTLQGQLEEGLAQTLDGGTPAPLPAIPERVRSSPRAAWVALPAALVLLGGLGVWWWWPAPAGDPIYAAVLAPRFEGTAVEDGAADQQLGFSVRSGVLHRLSQLPGISPKSFAEVDQVQVGRGKAPTFRQIAEAAGADELVIPTIFCAATDCSLRLDRWQLAGERTLGGERRDLPAEGLDLAARVAQHATSQLYPEHPLPKPDEEGAFSLPAYTRLMEIRGDLLNTRDSRQLDAWLAELRQLRQDNPGFHDLADTEVEIEWRRFSELRDEASRQRAWRLMRATLEAAPEDLDLLLRAAWLAKLDERPQEAEEFFARAEKAAPGDLRVTDHRAFLLERSGQLDQALALRRQALERRPSWRRSMNLVFVLYRMSRWQEIVEVLDDLLAKAPDFGSALAWRAQAELVAGDPGRAAARFRDLLARAENRNDRANLATAYLLQGDGNGAARESEKLLEGSPENPLDLFTLADARSLQGRQAEAAELYRRVADSLASQQDSQSLRIRAQVHARLGEKETALELLRQAMTAGPGYDGEMAFVAAIVYSLVGDRESAKTNIRNAVEMGWGNWLRLAPFAVWREDKEIAPLLAAGTKGLATVKEEPFRKP